MNFLAPGAFFLGTLLPVIVALYLLKLRRIEQNVSSIYLWRRMVRDVEANAPWQRLRFNILMVLQLLFLLALIIALSRPFTWAEGSSGQSTILILDSSASMSAIDVVPSRFESAKKQARQILNDMPDSARITIIEAGNEARVLLSSSLDRRQAHNVIDQLEVGTGNSDMTVALQLASAIAERQTGTDIIVLSDGRVNLPERIAIRGYLRYIPFGLSGENQSVSLVTLEETPGNVGLTAFAQISNYGRQPSSRRVSLFADGQLINVFDLIDIPPGGQKSIIADGISASTHMIEVRLDRPNPQTNVDMPVDILPLDDSAKAVYSQDITAHVNLVGGNNLFIQTALSLMDGITFTHYGAESELLLPKTPNGSTSILETAPADLTIFDNQIPSGQLPAGNLLFIDPPASIDLFTIRGLVENPTPRVLDGNKLIGNHITLSDISILDANDISLPSWANPVIMGDLKDGRSIPLLFYGEVDNQKIAVLSFNLHHSDLPLNIAFPLLWVNLMDWLAPGIQNTFPQQVASGQSVSFTLPGSMQINKSEPTAVFTRPDGSTVQVSPENGLYLFSETTQLGVYRVKFSENPNEYVFTVNLFSPLESNLNPSDSLPGLDVQENISAQGTQLGQREWWRPLTLFAVGLLCGEWLVYHRAGLAKLRDVLALLLPINRRKKGVQ